MILFRLLTTSVDHARRRWPLSLAAALSAALVAGGVVYLVGDSASRNENLVRSLRSPDARSIVFRAKAESPDLLLPGPALHALAELDGVELAVAFSKVTSATVAGFDDTDVAVGFFSAVSLRGGDPFRLTSGRQPQVGEVVASEFAMKELRLTNSTVGAVQIGNETLPIVGSYDPLNRGKITELLERSVLTPANADSAGFFTLAMIVRQPADVPAVVEAGRVLLGQQGPGSFTVEYDESAAGVEELVANAGNSSVRSTALGIVLVGALIEMVIAFLNALLQRREIARRRALGYTRGQVLGTLLLEGTMLSAVGAFGGACVAALVLVNGGGSVDLNQSLSSVALITLIGAVATVPAGALGAFQDPAQILRVP